MSLYDRQVGQQDERFYGAQREQRANANAQDWANYARQLEAQLAQAQAETLAARIQRNAYRNEAVRLNGGDEMSYRKRVADSFIYPELAQNGLRLAPDGTVTRIR